MIIIGITRFARDPLRRKLQAATGLSGLFCCLWLPCKQSCGSPCQQKNPLLRGRLLLGGEGGISRADPGLGWPAMNLAIAHL